LFSCADIEVFSFAAHFSFLQGHNLSTASMVHLDASERILQMRDP
jgi:hypothetical protein